MNNLQNFDYLADVKVFTKPNIVLVGGTNVYYNIEPYSPSNVFIQHKNGTLYTLPEWVQGNFLNSHANGVAITDSRCSFIIAPDQLMKVDGNGMKWSSDTVNIVEGATIATTEAEAREDYNGVANTTAIIATDTDGAAFQCANYTFPSGAKGYLPSLGELAVAFEYRAQIDIAMNLIGGHPLMGGNGI